MFKTKKNINYLVSKMLELYELLENYIWKYNSINFHIVIYNKEDSLEIRFMKDEQILDYFELKFNKKERKLYEYISLSYMFKLFENIIIFNDNNKFYNKAQKPYLEFIVDDPKLLSESLKIAKMINNYKHKEVEQLLEDKYYDIKRRHRTIDNNEKINLDQRLILTKKLLRGGVYE